MSRAASYLKAAWVRQQLELALPLLPAGSTVAIWYCDKLLASYGDDASSLHEKHPGVASQPLMHEGAIRGRVMLRLAHPSPMPPLHWCQFLAHGLQGMIDAMHARYSVTQEALESYREMALLQRAVSELNRSLRPSSVAASLLKEFENRKGAPDFGAVFLYNPDTASHSVIGSFGRQDDRNCAGFLSSALFSTMTGHPHGDILNNLAQSSMKDQGIDEYQSLLWLPLSVHEERLGLLVLATHRPDGFSAGDMKRAQTLVSVASSALHNAQLYAAEQIMFQSFVRVIATAIDAKSPYTAGHCRRVPEIALMLADKAHQAGQGSLADFMLDEDARNALEIAAMLHDCGKVVTPEWVVDKSTKLDCIHNRLNLVALRFEILSRDVLIDDYRARAEGLPGDAEACHQRQHALREDFAFLEKCNAGSEFISPEHVERIHRIAATRWRNAAGEEFPLLDDDEVYNLCIQRGTLNPEERKIIEDHAVHTINMLSQIAFPRTLRNVAEYAGGHHERVDGRGYPNGLTRDQLSVPARIIAIADIFEALTAPDRPYRKGGSLSWAVNIMHRMKDDGHIDNELFDLFLREGVHLAYAEKHLAPGQIDHVDIERYLARET